MRVRVFPKTLRVEIENETRVFPESLIFETEMRVSQKSVGNLINYLIYVLILAGN